MLNLYNTLTRNTEPFKPREDMKVKMYTCGPSTYQRAHIGNYRTFLFEDVLHRYLEYLGYKVTRLITLTDVEDKALAQAKKENCSVEELTSQHEDRFLRDFELLKIKVHDYTLAVAEGVSGREFSMYWLHGAHLFVEGKKMSKSKGNVYYPADLLAKGYRSEHVRFFLIYEQYRKKLNFTWKKLAETSRRLDAFKGMVKGLEKAESANSSARAKKLAANIVSSFEENMDNDLDVKAAFDMLHTTVATLHKLMKKGSLSAKEAKTAANGLRRVDSVLQVIF